jgi:Cytochrome c554 and c-prime
MRSAALSTACLVVALAAGTAGAQTLGRCAACHFANYLSVPGASHLSEWAQSAHARAGVGCESCHGGNPNTVVPGEAHAGVIDPKLPASPVAAANLPATCGKCHETEAAAFRRGPHAALLARGGAGAPTCSTCHGAMTARVPSPAALEARCAACHGVASPGASYPGRVRTLVENLDRIQTDLAQADWLLGRDVDPARRSRARTLRADAATRLKEAAEAWHASDLAGAEARAAAARTAVDALLDALGAPPARP